MGMAVNEGGAAWLKGVRWWTFGMETPEASDSLLKFACKYNQMLEPKKNNQGGEKTKKIEINNRTQQTEREGRHDLTQVLFICISLHVFTT